MNNSLAPCPPSSRQRGSAFFMILIAVALFAALSYAISQQRDSGKALTSEKTRLLASDVLDMGNKMSDTISMLRLRKIQPTQLSFENDIVAGYENLNCTTDKCKIFMYDGGGRDWETPTPDINSRADWIFTGDLSIENVGTASADLIAILPNLSLPLCTQINVMLGMTGTPSQFNGVIGNKFTGSFGAVPINLNSTMIAAKPAACVELVSPAGSGFTASLPNRFYAYYHVLSAR